MQINRNSERGYANILTAAISGRWDADTKLGASYSRPEHTQIKTIMHTHINHIIHSFFQVGPNNDFNFHLSLPNVYIYQLAMIYTLYTLEFCQ